MFNTKRIVQAVDRRSTVNAGNITSGRSPIYARFTAGKSAIYSYN